MKCQYFHLIDGKLMQCNRESTAIARRSDVCSTHFNLLLRDNKSRNKQGMKIPDSLETLTPPSKLILSICTKEITEPLLREVFIGEDVTGEIDWEIVNGDGL